MKPNEITQRDIDKWTRYAEDGGISGAHVRRSRQGVDAAGDRSAASRLLDTIAAKARLADLGEQSSVLAHELRQPLFSIAIANENLRMMLALGAGKQGQIAKAVERIAEQVQRAQSIIDHTLAYASGKSEVIEGADLGVCAANALRFLSPLLEAEGIEIDNGGAQTSCEVGLCQVEIEQVFVNILRNAAESIAARKEAGWTGVGRIIIRTSVEGGRVRCQVSDNGAGLSKEQASSVFEPFFTTKPRLGTGLGLHICRQVVGKLGGAISLEPGKSEGACVTIDLPLLDNQSD
jgi:two-component system, LuxR family, sensor kinase FixL